MLCSTFGPPLLQANDHVAECLSVSVTVSRSRRQSRLALQEPTLRLVISIVVAIPIISNVCVATSGRSTSGATAAVAKSRC